MTTVPIEEAAKCPKCNVLGIVTSNTKIRGPLGRLTGEDLTTYECVTEICKWFGTGWAVQSDKHGMVAVRNQGERGQDKDFAKLTPGALARGRMEVEQVQAETARQTKRTQRPK